MAENFNFKLQDFTAGSSSDDSKTAEPGTVSPGSGLYLDDSVGTLHWAAMRGEVAMLESLLLSDPSIVDVRNWEGKTALLCAAEHGQVAATKKLLEFFADPSDGCYDDFISWPPCIHGAAAAGQNGVIQVLLDSGVDIEMADHHGNTALFMAVVEKRLDTVLLLVKNGAEVNECNHVGLTPLEIAIDEGNLSMVKLLLESGAGIEKEGSTSNHLHIAAEADVAEVIGVLLEWATTEDINSRDETAATPLHRACAVSESTTISRLLDYDVTDVTLVDNSGLTPLHLCAESGNDEAAELLIDRGAEVNTTDFAGNTPLCIAAMQGEMFFCDGSINKNPESHLDIVKVLIEAGANVSHKNKCGNSPLMLALERGCTQVASLLIERGADLLIMDLVDRNTPLHYAVRQKSCGIVEVLASRGAELNRKNTMHIAPVDMIPGTNRESCYIFHILLLHGAEYRRHDSNIALSLFVRKTEMASHILLAHGAAIAEILSEEMAVKTMWRDQITTCFKGQKSIANLALQRPYRSLLKDHYPAQRHSGIEIPWGELSWDKYQMPKLYHLCIVSLREHLVHMRQGKSIWNAVLQLPVPKPVKDAVLMLHLDQLGLLRKLHNMSGKFK